MVASVVVVTIRWLLLSVLAAFSTCQGSDDWQWTHRNSLFAPDPPEGAGIVWTGKEVLISHGYDGDVRGGRYDPAQDTWRAMSISNAPTSRAYQSAIWTGKRLIVWGGFGGGTTHYLVANLNPTGYAQVIEELSPSGVTKRYSYGHALLAQRDIPASKTLYYHHDPHGSVRLLTDSTGSTVKTYTYDAFGILLRETTASPVPPVNNYRYAGEQWDPDLGMYYLRARYYDPDKGRFITMDSFEGTQEDPLSLHKYVYAHNNPANIADPSGDPGAITPYIDGLKHGGH